MIYRIEHSAQWQEACTAGAYPADGNFDGDGFIHCSARDQIEAVAERLHHGEQGLVLLCISQKLLRSEVRWELADDGLYYPHIYGLLAPEAVVVTLPFPCDPDGTFRLPAEMPDDASDLPENEES